MESQSQEPTSKNHPASLKIPLWQTSFTRFKRGSEQDGVEFTPRQCKILCGSVLFLLDVIAILVLSFLFLHFRQDGPYPENNVTDFMKNFIDHDESYLPQPV
ncbi:hypothetical protein J6590_077044 [Homalodisca vitripennis]|nr:hypothetical protein J6590_077044 [Homalodisca vitripennis]